MGNINEVFDFDAIGTFRNMGYRAILIGAGAGLVMTVLINSSTASITIIMAMAFNDIITYEMAARLNTENYLRYEIDVNVGENIKQACLMLIAHWYRNREAVTTGKTSVGVEMPFGYKELLSSERDYPVY